MKIRPIAALLVLTSVPACSSGPTILGTWRGGSPNANGWRLVVRDDGGAVWSTDAAGAFELRYRFDDSVTPHRFDLSGFDRGPLEGQTLYGIVELTADGTLRWDAEPGATEHARPTAFAEDATRTMVRAR